MKTLKILCLIPLILLALGILSFCLACILETPLNRSSLYEFFAVIGLVLLFIGWLPSFCLSLATLIISTRKQMRKYIEFAVVDIVISVLWFILSMLMFMGGMSV